MSSTFVPLKENSPLLRRLLIPFLVLAGLGALQLYILPDQTDRFFAWTLRPAPSATFMGAGFAAGLVLTWLSYRRQPWAVTRIATISILVFVLAMLVATLLHLDRMHLDSEVASARFAAWLWIVVYVLVGPLLLYVLFRQRRALGADPVRTRPLPGWLATSLTIEGLVLLFVGAALFLAPTAMNEVWPWEITPLAARALGAWILAIAVAALQARVENDLVRARPAAATFAVLAVLLLLAIIRHSSDFRWDAAGAYVYVVVVVVSGVLGATAWRLGGRHP